MADEQSKEGTNNEAIASEFKALKAEQRRLEAEVAAKDAALKASAAEKANAQKALKLERVKRLAPDLVSEKAIGLLGLDGLSPDAIEGAVASLRTSDPWAFKPAATVAEVKKVPLVTDILAGGEAHGNAGNPEDMMGPINLAELPRDLGSGAEFTMDSFWNACFAKGLDPRETVMKYKLPSRNPFLS